MREGWTYKTFDEVFDLQMGKTPDRKTPQYFGGDNVWVSIRDMNKKEIFDSNEHITDEAVVATNIRKVKKGTVIMSFKLTVGKCAIAAKDLYTNEAIMAFNLKEGYDISADFLYYYLQGYKWEGANKAVMGLTLNKATISQHKIGFPSLPEQQSIVAELDKINELISLKKSQLSDLDSLAQSIFYDMFGDPVVNEKGWEVKKLGDISKIGDGLHGTPMYDELGNCFFINGNNLENGKIVITKETRKVNDREKEKYFIEFNDNTLFVSINGTIGNVAFYNKENIILGKSACYIVLNDNINKEYIMGIIKSPYFLVYVQNEYTGTTIKNVSLKSMRNFPIPLPPLHLQQSFATKIAKIEADKLMVKASLRDLEMLLASRMHYWFD